jgi:outer membrane lipoprotein-sorting protein
LIVAIATYLLKIDIGMKQKRSFFMAFKGWKVNRLWIGFAISPLLLLLFLMGCGSTTTSQDTTPTPANGPMGQQLLTKAKQALDTAKTLHAQFNLTLGSQGTTRTEVWNEAPAKNRFTVFESTLAQFVAGSVTVNNGKQVWQYYPKQKVVYTSPAVQGDQNSSSASTMSQTLTPLDLVKPVFTANATQVSSPTTINGHTAYDVHVISQASDGKAAYSGEVYLDQTTNLPVQVNLDVQGIGKTILDIPLLTVNEPLPGDTFVFTPPAGVKVESMANKDSGTKTLTLAQAQQQAGYHLLSIPGTQAGYTLQHVSTFGQAEKTAYMLSYTKGTQTITIIESKTPADQPGSGTHVTVRGLPGMISNANGITILTWTEKGISIRMTGALSNPQLLAIAQTLS